LYKAEPSDISVQIKGIGNRGNNQPNPISFEAGQRVRGYFEAECQGLCAAQGGRID
jgi:hypothetical protein